MQGYNATDFVLLKPKLAYAVGRSKSNISNPNKINKINKIVDFYDVMSRAIDLVENDKHFKNFIKVFEAIVAYHKVAETGIKV